MTAQYRRQAHLLNAVLDDFALARVEPHLHRLLLMAGEAVRGVTVDGPQDLG